MDKQGEIFTDHFELHQEGDCGRECPWCKDEECDHGGEG